MAEQTKPKYLDRPFRIVDRPLAWQTAGLQQTRSGYGRKLTSTRCVLIDGETRLRRIYVVCYSNAGTPYILINGEMHIVREWEAHS